ncbi:MAG: 3-oxosteroid 1-dehydrogenase [Porticoccaceae bacterium]|nr:MAG: 3-oxosteroid 1-dehydrogenase [Porticoccaceae bacterium]
MIDNRPDRWDLEADFVAVGSGIGGLAAAIAARELGLQSVVLERSPKLGGVTALSMGELWVPDNDLARARGIEDSAERAYRYLARLSLGYGSDEAIYNFTLHGREALAWFAERIGFETMLVEGCPDYYYGVVEEAVAEGRLLEPAPFPAAELGEWRERTRVSPQLPYGMTHADIAAGGGVANIARWDFARMGERLARDERCLGPALAARFVKGALARRIPLFVDTAVEELIADGRRVVGVRARREGRPYFVRASRGVLIATSSYERRQDYNRTLGRQLELGSMVFSAVDGANFRLAGPLGARPATVPDVTSLGFVVPGEEDEEGHPLWRSALQTIGQPHVIVVNRRGRRFGDEAFYRDLYYAVDRIDGGRQEHPNFPCFMIFDRQARAKYPIGPILPDQRWPEGLGMVAESLEELARQAGIDPAGLVAEVAEFNRHAREGRDPAFGRGSRPWSHWMCGDPHQRPNPNLGTLEEPPFFCVPLKRLGGSAIPATGLLTDRHARVIGWDDAPISGLYAAGNAAARLETGAMMQSGISNARGMVHGWLAAHHAAGCPSRRLEEALAELGGLPGAAWEVVS